jgi:NAD(P)-dependent dehydrogenase (short-subunit alcohol dehydrogenase family)
MKKKSVVIILSVSSDIGFFLAKKYLQDGYQVIGTYRFWGKLSEIEDLPDCRLFYCDISDKKSVQDFFRDLERMKIKWDIFISCVGDLRPYDNFFGTNFDVWEDSVRVNSTEQLRVVHALCPLRNKKTISSIVFFAGGGVNSAPIGLSAYTASKIMLIKMCELLDAENPDLKAFIVGPGYIKTKIHDSIKADIAKGKKQTNLADVYQVICWLTAQDKQVVGGRNFSIAHDPLFGIGACMLARELSEDPEMYKLRRCGNDCSPLISIH